MNKRKILTLVLAAIMLVGTIVGSMSTAFADEVDKAPNELSVSAQKLIALGIVEGRGDGNIDPDSNITRAEVTAIILRAMGVKSSNYSFKQSFVDVPESAWYAKDLTVAKELNLVYGIGNDKFAPEQNVTNAQLITMLIRALGYEKMEDEVSYPIFHITKAQQVGILKGVESDINEVSTRQDMFLLIDNALDAKVLEFNSFGVYVPSDKTMMEAKLKVNKYDVKVVNSGNLLGETKGTIEIEGPFGKDGKLGIKTIKTDNEDLLNVNNLLRDFEVLIDKDNKILFAKIKDNNEIKTDVVKEVIRDRNEDLIRFKDLRKDYKLSDDLTIIHNFEVVKPRDLSNLLVNETIQYTLQDDKINSIIVNTLNKVDIFKDYKDEMLNMVSGSRISLKSMDSVLVYINGTKSTVEDLKANDLIYSFIKNDEIIINAVRSVLKGELTSIGKLNDTVKIDEKEYKLSKNYKVSVNNGKTLNTDNIEDLIGAEVSIYLNENSEIELIIGNVDSRLESIYVIERLGYNNRDEYVSLIDGNDKITDFKVDRKVDLRNLSEGDLVVVSFYGDTIESIAKITTNSKLKYHSLVELTEVNKDNIDIKRLKITKGNLVEYVKSLSTPVFNVKNNNVEVLKFENLENFIGNVDMKLVIRDRDVIAIYINDQDFKLKQDEVKGVVQDIYVSTKDGKRATYVKIELYNGDIVDYALDTNVQVSSFVNNGFGKIDNSMSNIIKGEIITLTLDNKNVATKVDEVKLTANLDLRNNVVKSTNRYEVVIGSQTYELSNNALIVETRRRVEVLRSSLDIPVDSLVVFSMENGRIDNLIIVGTKGDNLENTLVYETEFKTSVAKLSTEVTKYKETDLVKLSELNILVQDAQAKLALVQSQKEVVVEAGLLANLVIEVNALETTNNANVLILQNLLTEIRTELTDFVENEETVVTEEVLVQKLADATIALDNIKDKTVLTNEVQTLADLNSELQVHLESLDAPVLP